MTVLNEAHFHQLNEDTRAGKWLYGHLAAWLLSLGHRGNETLII